MSSSVKCGHVAAYQSAGHTTEFVNIVKNVVVASKIHPVETGPTVLVAMALISLLTLKCGSNHTSRA